ncbi:MAG: hypothetical protein Q9195_003792 [Heterodermia aff. obscurata]
MTNFNISVVSDTVCPWCYVGKNRQPFFPPPPPLHPTSPKPPQYPPTDPPPTASPELDLAIAAHKARFPSDTFTTTWHPYYLNPAAPTTSVDKRTMYASKFGPERSAMMFQRLETIGKEVGIRFSFGGKTGNTRDSHRLIQLAGTKGADVQEKVVERLFRAYFEEEKDITSREVLRDAAVESGLGQQEVSEWLEGDMGGEQVDREVKEAQMKGISGVPNFVLQGQLEIGGAQDPEAFVRAFEQVKAVEG